MSYIPHNTLILELVYNNNIIGQHTDTFFHSSFLADHVKESVSQGTTSSIEEILMFGPCAACSKHFSPSSWCLVAWRCSSSCAGHFYFIFCQRPNLPFFLLHKNKIQQILYCVTFWMWVYLALWLILLWVKGSTVPAYPLYTLSAVLHLCCS